MYVRYVNCRVEGIPFTVREMARFGSPDVQELNEACERETSPLDSTLSSKTLPLPLDRWMEVKVTGSDSDMVKEEVEGIMERRGEEERVMDSKEVEEKERVPEDAVIREEERAIREEGRRERRGRYENRRIK